MPVLVTGIQAACVSNKADVAWVPGTSPGKTIRGEVAPSTFPVMPVLVTGIQAASNLPMPKPGYVYILASAPFGTLYVGVTSDLAGRVWEHKEGVTPGFTSRYGVKTLVYYEAFDDIGYAISREKTLKGYPRRWKINLIERTNPHWRDLVDEIGPF
jgi:putative endonuclease